MRKKDAEDEIVRASLAKKLDVLFKKLLVRPENLSKSLGVTETTLILYRTGRIAPSLKILKKLCSLYKVNLNWLLGCEEEQMFITDTKKPESREGLTESDLLAEEGEKKIFAKKLLNSIIASLGITKEELYYLMPEVNSEASFLELLENDDSEITLRQFRTLACRICADFEESLKNKTFVLKKIYSSDNETSRAIQFFRAGMKGKTEMCDCPVTDYVFFVYRHNMGFFPNELLSIWFRYQKYGGCVMIVNKKLTESFIKSLSEPNSYYVVFLSSKEIVSQFEKNYHPYPLMLELIQNEKASMSHYTTITSVIETFPNDIEYAGFYTTGKLGQTQRKLEI